MLELVEDKDQENIIGLSREEIGARFLSLGLQKFRSGQVWHWLYHKGATSFEEMTTLSKKVRAQLGQTFSIKRPTVSEKQKTNRRLYTDICFGVSSVIAGPGMNPPHVDTTLVKNYPANSSGTS